jgi:hypothetical protein
MPSQPRQHLSSIPLPLHLTEDEWYQRVSRKASERYPLRGEEPGQDRDDGLATARVGHQELRPGPPVPHPIVETDDRTADDDVRPEHAVRCSYPIPACHMSGGEVRNGMP